MKAREALQRPPPYFRPGTRTQEQGFGEGWTQDGRGRANTELDKPLALMWAQGREVSGPTTGF